MKKLRAGYRQAAIVVVSAAALGFFFLLWLRIPWAWSPIDDAGHVQALNARIDEHGWLAGMIMYTWDLFSIDRSWALFRPSYWVYPAIFYQIPIGLGHVLRLVMAGVAVAGPVLYFKRQGASSSRLVITGILMAGASGTLLLGLYFVSLQELSASAFIGLGMLFRRRGLRLTLWVIAAWFKSPFAWLLIGEGIVLWRRGEKKLAITAWVIGTATLAISAIMARGGSYTGSYALDVHVIWNNVPKLIEPMNAYLLVMVIWWVAITSTRMQLSSSTVVFGVAFAGYTVQLLPWSVTAYYMGGISYLLGLLLASILTNPEHTSMAKSWVALSVPAGVAVLLVAWPIRQGLEINTVVAGLGSCLQRERAESSVMTGSLVYVTSSPEAPYRIMQNIELEDPTWRGKMRLEDSEGDGFLDPTTTHYVVVGEGGLPTTREATEVCQAGIAKVYRLGAK